MFANKDVLLSATGVSKSFRDGKGMREILHEVDIDVHRGELVGLLGASGRGKSTLLKVVGGLLAPDTGTVRIGQETLNYNEPKQIAEIRRVRLGWITQGYDLIEQDSVADNIALPLLLAKPRPTAKQIAEKVAAVMETVGLRMKPYVRVSNLSGGEKQRVAVARALVHDPLLIIADEPTAALDAATGSKIADLLRELAGGETAVLAATHDALMVDACDRIYQFTEGATLSQTPL